MSDIAWKVMSLSQLSILLEVSSPKPGNVNRLRAFSDTGYRHFLASSALLGRGLYESAIRGIALASNEITAEDVGLGELIFESSKDVFGGLNKSNTILGTILLYIPMVVASSAMLSETQGFDGDCLEKWVKSIIDSSTVNDTLNVYRAFHIANPGGDKNREVNTWTDIHDRYDINNPNVIKNINEDNLTLVELFRLSSEVETLSNEWSNYFSDIITEVFPYLNNLAGDLNDLEEGIVRTFLWFLAKQPDGLIIKKAGIQKAKEIQSFAKQIIVSGSNGQDSSRLLDKLDTILRSDGNRYNPGTTADIVSVAILLKLIEMSF